MTTIAMPRQTTAALQLLSDIRTGAPLLWPTIIAMGAFALVCAGLGLIDERMLRGISVWDKPAKFFLSLAVQFATVSWTLSLLPLAERAARRIRWALFAMLVAGWFEMSYMVFRAARAEESHFNVGTPIASLFYGLMGVGALTLTVTAAYIGYLVWRRRRAGLWTEAAGLGLMLGALLGTLAGAYLSAQSGHSVGGSLSDVTGLGFFRWSTTGGDLRVAHFVGLHAAQIVPLAALSSRRWVVHATALSTLAITAAVFIQAVLGIPLLRG